MGSLNSYLVGIYVRESRDENEENFDTIETQRGLLVDFVNKEKLGKIQCIYVDDNVSGAGFERQGIELLKSDVIAGRINLLVLKDLSRLGRNNARTLLFLDFLEEYGVRVVTFDRKYDSMKDNDTVGIETWFNERYIRDISKKIRANLRYKIEKGEYIGRPPYGFKKSENEKNRLCIDSTTAYVVKDIFRLYREGYGYEYIANHLNERGIPSPSSKNNSGYLKNRWNPVAIRRILCNRAYIGDTVQGVSEKISFKSKKTRRLPLNKWVITTNTHEPVISREEFEQVQHIRAAKFKSCTRHKGEIHLLSGLLFCGKCGSIMYARTRLNRLLGYVCGNYAKHGKECCLSHHVIENYIVDILLSELIYLFNIDAVKEKAIKLLEMNCLNKKDGMVMEKLEQLLSAKQKQQDILYTDRLEGKISEQLFERMNTNIEGRITLLMEEIRQKKSENQDFTSAQDILNNTLEYLLEGNITYEIVRLIVERIIIYDAEDKEELFEKEQLPSAINLGKTEGAIIIEFRF